MGRKKQLPLLEHVTITDIAAEGKALARIDNRVVFVPMAVPGDVVDIQVRRKRKGFFEAMLLRCTKLHPSGRSLYVSILVYVADVNGKCCLMPNS